MSPSPLAEPAAPPKVPRSLWLPYVGAPYLISNFYAAGAICDVQNPVLREVAHELTRMKVGETAMTLVDQSIIASRPDKPLAPKTAAAGRQILRILSALFLFSIVTLAAMALHVALWLPAFSK